MKLLRTLVPLAALMLAACADSPTGPERVAETSTSIPVQEQGAESGLADCCVLEPIIVIGDPGGDCDPYTQLDNSCDGGGECMAGTGSPASPQEQGMSGCHGGGGGDGGGYTGPGDSPGGGSGDSGGGTSSTSFPSATGPAAEGPLAWGACVLAVPGSVYTVDQVAGEFKTWWEAERRYRIAFNNWSYLLSHPERQLYDGQIYDLETRVDIALDARDAAGEDVRDATGGSILALLGAATACGIAAIAPAP